MNNTLLMEEKRFNKIYAFICVFGGLMLILISALVFFNIPEKNQQSANMALAFCMSAFTGLMGYLIGASPEKKRTDVPVSPVASVPSNTTVLTLNWVGSFEEPPQNPAVNDAYTNTRVSKNYYWTGSSWEVTTQNPA